MKQHTLMLTCILCFGISGLTVSQTPKPNIIFIISDDLNDYLGVLGGHPQIQTPNLDSLANAGILSTNAYTPSPSCAPARASMLSGKDCLYTNVYNNDDYLDEFRDNFTV